MKIGKATVYFYSHDNPEKPLCELINTLDNANYVDVKIFDSEVVNMGEWYDEIPINKHSATKEDYETYFRIDMNKLTDMFNTIKDLYKLKDFTGMSLEDIKESVIKNNEALNVQEREMLGSQIKFMFELE